MSAAQRAGALALLALGDLAGWSEADIKRHIADNYAGSVSGFDYGSPSDDEKAQLLAKLDGFDFLVAYESVGNWGCDSSSWFLMRDKQTGTLYENYGSHCSCFGFEGQWEPEETSYGHIASEKFYFPAGGYDDASEGNADAVKEYARAATGASS